MQYTNTSTKQYYTNKNSNVLAALVDLEVVRGGGTQIIYWNVQLHNIHDTPTRMCQVG